MAAQALIELSPVCESCTRCAGYFHHRTQKIGTIVLNPYCAKIASGLLGPKGGEQAESGLVSSLWSWRPGDQHWSKASLVRILQQMQEKIEGAPLVGFTHRSRHAASSGRRC
jgi:hypothetical protein